MARDLKIVFTLALCTLTAGVCFQIWRDSPAAAQHGSVSQPALPTLWPHARKGNDLTDDYAMLAASYGQPDFVLSTENAQPKPKMAVCLVRYTEVGLNVIMVKNDCVDSYHGGMERVLKDFAKYPGIARANMEKLQPCIAPAGSSWTIVGYTDHRYGEPVSASDATRRVRRIKEKRTQPPVVESGSLDERQRKLGAALADDGPRALPAGGSPSSDTDTVRRGCAITYLKTIDKRVSDLTVGEIQTIDACKALGLYH